MLLIKVQHRDDQTDAKPRYLKTTSGSLGFTTTTQRRYALRVSNAAEAQKIISALKCFYQHTFTVEADTCVLVIKVQRFGDAVDVKARYLKTTFPHKDSTGFNTTLQRGRAMQLKDAAEAKAILNSLRGFTLHTFTVEEKSVVETCTTHHYVCTICGATKCQ